jgi:hypothetical protein
MGSSDGQAAMTAVWVVLVLAAVAGAGLYALMRRRARRP